MQCFLLGLIVGGVIGMALYSCMVVSSIQSKQDEELEEMIRRKEQQDVE